jgi:hypothetical protein
MGWIRSASVVRISRVSSTLHDGDVIELSL